MKPGMRDDAVIEFLPNHVSIFQFLGKCFLDIFDIILRKTRTRKIEPSPKFGSGVSLRPEKWKIKISTHHVLEVRHDICH